MTFSAVVYALAAVVWLTLTAVGVAQVRTGRVLWRPLAGRVTDARAHGWLFIALAALSASQALVMELDGPAWLLVAVVAVGLTGVALASRAAFRRPPAPAPTTPVAWHGPADPGEVFRRPRDDG